MSTDERTKTNLDISEVSVFRNPDFGEVRTLTVNDEPWFVGKDVSDILGYRNPSDAIGKHVDDEDKGVAKCDTLGGRQDIVIINESGLYSLILRSRMPEAHQFKRWVTSEVLPTIRKHGAYMTPETLQAAILNPDTMIQLCQQLKAEQDKNRVLRAENSKLVVDKAIMQPKADYFDELVERNTLTNFRETAKELCVKEKDFIRFLVDRKYLYRDKKGHLLPYAGRGDGLFEVKESINTKTGWSGTQTLVTPKGRETFRLLYPAIP